MGNIGSNKKSEVEKTQFTKKEINKLRNEFEKIASKHQSVTKEQFMEVIKPHVQYWTAGTMFLERLFDAFDVNGDKTIDCNEFVNGMLVFIKGTPAQKLELTFKMYDLNRDGRVTQKEIVKFLTNLYSTFYTEDQSVHIKEMAKRLFDDLDINGDGELSLEEYKLSALKEPMVVNFLEQFLGDKDISQEQQLEVES